MLRIASFLILLSSIVFAAGNTFAGFGDRLPVYMIGDASGAADAFNFVAMLINNNVLYSIILAGVVVAVGRMAMKLMDHSAEGTLGEFLYIFVVYIFFLSPTADVAVVDARVYSSGVNLPDVNATAETGYVSYQTVDNIPLGIAAIASFTTVVSWDFAKLIDTVISPVGSVGGQYLGITRAGYSAPSKDMRWAIKNIGNGIGGEKSYKDYEYMFFQYVRECALPTIDVDIRNASKIMNPPDGDYKTYLSPASLPVGGTLIQDPITKAQVDCTTYWNTNLSGEEATFENNLLTQFRTHKGFDANGGDLQYEAGLRNLFNGVTTSSIANLKDTFGALKRASIVKQSIAASGTGISGIDMANQMAMTEAKQNSMVQGASTWAWIGEMLPVGINISIGFLVVMSALMSVFLLFQGWIKGMKVILNFAAGFFALTFSYVSLAITQGIVNRRAYYDVVEQYTSQGHPLQVSNYNFLLENAASMEGMTGLLGSLFVVAGSAIVFYGESKFIVGGMMGKVQGAFGGNNLDKQLDDNAKDKALTESMMEEARQNKMSSKLAQAGIPVDGGNIEYEYAKFQKELSEIGSARGTHMAMTGDATIDGDASIEDRIKSDGMMKEKAEHAISDTMSGSGMQSFEKAKSVQGYGSQATNNGDFGQDNKKRSMEEAMNDVEAGAFSKGRGAAAASLGESALLQTEQKADAFVEGMKRDAQVKTAKTIGAGEAIPLNQNGSPIEMDEYLKNMERSGAYGFTAAGIKAEAIKLETSQNKDGSIDMKDAHAKGIYRGEGANLESTTMMGMASSNKGAVSNAEFIANSATAALEKHNMGQIHGSMLAGQFGRMLGGAAGMIPDTPVSVYGQQINGNGATSESSDTKGKEEKKSKPFTEETAAENYAEDAKKPFSAKSMVEKVTGDSFETDEQKKTREMLEGKGKSSSPAPFNPSIAKGDLEKPHSSEVGKGESSSFAENYGEKPNLTTLSKELNKKETPSSKQEEKESFETIGKDGPRVKGSKDSEISKEDTTSKTDSLKDVKAKGSEGDTSEVTVASSKSIGIKEKEKVSIKKLPENNSDAVSRVMQYAKNMHKQDRPYLWGGTQKGKDDEDLNPEGCTDCSGFTQYSAKVGQHVNIPRTAAAQFSTGIPIKPSEMKKGDYVYFNSGKRGRVATHTGIYAGVDEKTGKHMFYEENGSRADMKFSALEDRNDYVGARRFTSSADTKKRHGGLSFARGTSFKAMQEKDLASLKGNSVASSAGGGVGGRSWSGGGSGWLAMASAQEGKKIDEFIGGSSAIIQNKSDDSGVYSRNAFFKETTSAKGTSAAIAAQGGMQSAIATSVMMSAVSAGEQQSSLSGKIQGLAKQQLGMDPNAAEQLSKGLLSGSTKAGDVMAKSIVGAAGALALAMSQGQTEKSVETVKKSGGSQNFIDKSAMQGALSGQEMNISMNLGKKNEIMRGSENTSRQKVAETIGAGSIKYQDDKGNAVSQDKFFKGFESQGAMKMMQSSLEAKESEHYVDNDKLERKSLKTRMARGTALGAVSKLESVAAVGDATASDGVTPLSKEGYRETTKTQTMKKVASGVFEAKALTEEFGSNLTGTSSSTGKTLKQELGGLPAVSKEEVQKAEAHRKATLETKEEEGKKLSLDQKAAQGDDISVISALSNIGIDKEWSDPKENKKKKAEASSYISEQVSQGKPIEEEKLSSIIGANAVNHMKEAGADFDGLFNSTLDIDDTKESYQRNVSSSRGIGNIINKRGQEIASDTSLDQTTKQEQTAALVGIQSKILEDGPDAKISKSELKAAGFKDEQMEEILDKGRASSLSQLPERRTLGLNHNALSQETSKIIGAELDENTAVQTALSKPITEKTLAQRKSDINTVKEAGYAVADELYGKEGKTPDIKKLRAAEADVDKLTELTAQRGGYTDGVHSAVEKVFPDDANKIATAVGSKYVENNQSPSTQDSNSPIKGNKENGKDEKEGSSNQHPSSGSGGKTFAELESAHAKKKVDEFIGSGTGIINNESSHPGIYKQNAEYGEQSKALSTDAKIQAQGGIEKAVSIDTKEAAVKAGMQEGSVNKQVMELALSTGMGQGSAEQLVSALATGGSIAAGLIAAGITGAASDMAGAQSGAKTRGDLKNIEMSGGQDAFIEAAGVEGGKKGVVSKTQNIDLLDQEKSQNYINDIDRQVLQHQSPEERKTSVERMKSAGMVTEDSTVDNLKATSGETFAFAQAKLAAGAMDRSERFAIGGTSINAVRDTATGHARLESNSGNSFNDGDQVNHNYGVNVKNPLQFAAHETGAFSSTNMGTDNASILDNAGGVGVVAGVVAASAIGVDKTFNKGRITKKAIGAADGIVHKAKGNVNVGGDWYDKNDIPTLENDGIIEKKADGAYGYSEGKGTNEGRKSIQESLSRPTVSVGENSPQTNAPTIHNTNPAGMPINKSIDSPLKDIYSGNDTTIKGNTANIATLNNMSSAEVGKVALKSQATSAKTEAIAEIESATKVGDASAVEAGEKKLAAANNVLSGVERGEVLSKDVKASGIKTPHIDTDTSGKFPKATVNFESMGESLKAQELPKLEGNIDGIRSTRAEKSSNRAIEQADARGAVASQKYEADILEEQANNKRLSGSTPDDMPMPKTRAGKLLGSLMVATGATALFTSSSDARGVQASMVPENVAEAMPTSVMDNVGLATQGAFNAVNAVGAGMEIKAGASSNIGDLGKASSYKDGFKTIAKDAVDVSDFKGVASSFADEGAVEGLKLGGKALGKSAMKKLPFVGVAAGAAFAYDRASDGDYVGAAMEFASGAVSMIPGVGTAASVAIDGALMKRDYDASHPDAPQTVPSTENNVTPTMQTAPSFSGNNVSAESNSSPLRASSPRDNFNTVSKNVSSMDNATAGESHLAAVTPSENREEIVNEAKGGSLTRTKMIEKGVPRDIAEQTPVNDKGFVDVEKTGSMYKDGLSSMDAVMNMPNTPSFKFGNGVVNSLENGNMSNVAANSLATQNIPSAIVPPQVATVAPVTTSEVTTQAVASAEPSTTIVKETVVMGGASSGGTSTVSIDASGDNVAELAKATTSPGNIQVQNADLKKSIDEVAQASSRGQEPQATPQQVDLNSLAIGDFANGMAFNAPIQTMGGELTLGSKGGYVTLGQGENAFVTGVPSEAIQNAPESTRDVLASTLSNTKLNNSDVQSIVSDDAGISTKMGHTEEIMQEMNVLGKSKAMDDRLVLSDQVELLGGIIEELEKTRLSSTAENNKGVA